MKGMSYLKNVVTLNLDIDKCTGCGMCVTVCPHAVFELNNGKSFIRDRDECMECGACQSNCPVDAIKVRSGVGCATGVLKGAIRGTESTCDCSSDSDKSCC